MESPTNVGSIQGYSSTAFGTPTSVTGKKGMGINFDSGSDYYSVPFTLNQQAALRSYSFNVWVYPHSAVNDPNYILTVNPGALFSMELDATYFRCAWYDGGQSYATATIADPTNAWHMVSCTYNHTTRNGSIFVDGVYYQSVQKNNLTDFTGTQYITYNVAAQNFDGVMDELMYMNNSLTPAEIIYLYNGGSGRTFTEIYANTSITEYQVQIFNENNNQPFDFSQNNYEITVLYSCNGTTRNETIPDSSGSSDFGFAINISTCDGLDHLTFNVECNSTSESYFRNVYVNGSDILGGIYYLIDSCESSYVLTNFRIVQFLDIYENPRINASKLMGASRKQIGSEVFSLGGNAPTYLLQNSLYNLYLYSDNHDPVDLGSYIPTNSEDVILPLFNIDFGSTPTGSYNNIEFQFGTFNISDSTFAYLLYNDTENKTLSVGVYFWYDDVNGTLINNTNYTNQSSIFSYQNIDLYLDKDVYISITVVHEDILFTMNKLVYAGSIKTEFPMPDLPMAWRNWAALLLLVVIMLSGTQKHSALITLVGLGLIALLRAFGWISLHPVILFSMLGLTVFTFLKSLLRDKEEKVL